MLRVGSKFDTFDELSQRLEEFQKIERVQLWVRDSRTVIAAAKRARRKSLNPALKYAELTYSCVFGGRRPSDQTKVHNQTSAGGCPFKVRLSTSGDGQALVVKEICHNHNHEPGKKLHDEPRRLYKKTHNSRATQDSQENYAINSSTGATTNTTAGNNNKPIKLIVSKHRLNSAGSPFANLQQLQQQHQQQHGLQQQQQQQHHLQQQQQQPQPLKLHLHTTVHHQQHQQCYIKKEEPDQLTEVDIGPTPEPMDTPDHLYSMDFQSVFPYNTPNTSTPSSGSLSNTPGSSMANTPSNSPNTSPTNSLSSGLEEPVLTFNLPPSPISPSIQSTQCSLEGGEEEERLEPLYDLSEALEDGLASLPSVDSDDVSAMCDTINKPADGSTTTLHSQPLAVTTTNFAASNTVHQLPVVRTVSTNNSTNTVRVGYPLNHNKSVYKPNTITTSNGNVYINADGCLVKAVKTSISSNVPSVQYNLVSSKIVSGTGVPSGVSSTSATKTPGKITIQQYLSSTVAPSTATYSSTTSKGTSNLVTGAGVPPLIVGVNSTGVSSNSSSNSSSSNNNNNNSAVVSGHPCGGNGTIGCSLVNGGMAGGPVRNYRAKISKKPYLSGGILKVVRSDNIPNSKTYDTVDRLINTITPNNKVSVVQVRNNTSPDHQQYPTQTSPNIFNENPSNIFDNDLDSFGCEMDRVISGGLEADVKIKSELVEGAGCNNFPSASCDDNTGLIFGGNNSGKSSFSDGVIGGNIKDEPTLGDFDMDNQLNEALFVLDGLDETTLCGDIPMTPESLFNVADIDNYDVLLF